MIRPIGIIRKINKKRKVQNYKFISPISLLKSALFGSFLSHKCLTNDSLDKNSHQTARQKHPKNAHFLVPKNAEIRRKTDNPKWIVRLWQRYKDSNLK